MSEFIQIPGARYLLVARLKALELRKRLQILGAYLLVAASYRVQGGLGLLPVPIFALSMTVGLVACVLLGIDCWIPFILGALLCFPILAYIVIQILLVADNASTRTELIGKIPRMKSEWILRERNAEVRKLITENLSWPKILSDLRGELVDGWNEYELYRIRPKDRLMREPFLLLKMRCPSSDSDYVLCVPPRMKTAREAIIWVNSDIAPEDFIKQT